MSSDGYFDDDLDSAILREVDILEAQAMQAAPVQNAAATSRPIAPAHAPRQQDVIELDSDDVDMSFYVDSADLERLDAIVEDAYRGKAPPAARPSFSRTNSRNAVQTTLDGGVATSSTFKAPSSVNAGPSRSRLNQRNNFGVSHESRKVKTWDHSRFAKMGWKRWKSEEGQDKGRGKGKGKSDASADNDREDEEAIDEEDIEFEQFPAPFVPEGPIPPMKLSPEISEAQTWVYPLNRPKRDYQFNIVQHCLFENTLVALPTGLGKTFIAGVVMLNFWRWFPDGKIFFVAPTKPLVNQQVNASHQVCGIPGSHAAELTGEVNRAKRRQLYKERRVFYMTPQTLMNDLAAGTCDPTDLVLLVVDEAHRGTGDHSYAQCVRYLMAKNPHFRLLALTATPGRTPEAVQAIVDALHISRIEIRNEESMDLKQYVFKKHLKQHIIRMTGDIVRIRDKLVKLMEPLIRQVTKAGIMYGSVDPATMHPYRPQAAMAEIHKRRDGQQLRWAFPVLAKLSTLARAMGYLVEANAEMFYGCLKEVADGSSKEGQKKAQATLRKDPTFVSLMEDIQGQRDRGFEMHPKMVKLQTLLIDYFAKQADGEGGESDSKVMVFVTFRGVVDEIVEMLNRENPLIRATPFIGQSTDKKGKSGYTQKKQLDVMERFKKGEWNVLVCTSIGEEGLDIGEIDMIVCYDAQKTPIRMLQRIGRTGRKRDGYVHVLLAEGREESNWDKAKEQYAAVQDSIVRSEQLELYADVERLIPESIKPVPEEKVMEIEEYERPQARRAKQKEEGFIRALENKRKKKSHVGVDLPAGAASGFVSVKDLIVKQTKKRKQPEEFDPDGGVDDDTDKEIEEGLRSLRRTVSTPVGAKKSQKRRTDSVRSEGVAQKASKAKVTAPRKKNKKLAVPDGKELPRVVEDDSDDVDIERGLTTFNTALKAFSLPAQRVQSRTSPVPSRKIAVDRSFIDLDPSDGVRSSPASDSGSPRRKILTTPDKRHLPTSLRPSKSRSTSASRSRSPEPSPTAEDMPPSSPAGPSTPASHRERSASHEHDDISWLLEDSEDEAVVNAPAPLRSPQRPNGPGFTSNMSPKRSKAVKGDMAPPDIPARISGRPEIESPVPFESSLPLRAAGKRRAKVLESPGLLGSSPSEMPPPSQRRLRRLPSQSPEAPKAKRKKRKVQDTAELAKINPWVEVEADHSGDEVSEGSSLDDFLVESEGDRQFLEEADETQASPSYQQTQIYRESLLSQAPNRAGGPLFANRPARRGALGIAGGRSSRRVQGVSSSPPQEPGSEDEYEFGTFVVEDDAEISYAGSSEL